MLAVALAGCAEPEPAAGPPPPQESSSSPSPDEEPTATPSEPAGPPVASVRLALLPGVSQPGPTTATAPEASLAVATVRPARSGGEVLLQRSSEAGWDTVSSAVPDDAGIARFDDLAASDAEGTFRARVLDGAGEVDQDSEPVTGPAWSRVLDEPFDGTSLDSSVWGYRSVGVYNLKDDGRCATSSTDAVTVADGRLKLRVLRDRTRAGERCRTEHGTFDYFLNGRIDTENRFGFTHGVAAARVKFQQGRGQHGAFWLQREATTPLVPGDPGSSGTEVDVAEFFGDGAKDGGMGTYVYYTDARGEETKVGGIQPDATSRLPAGDTWWDRFHVFSLEWTPGGYVYRVDGREIQRTSRGVSQTDEFLVLSLTTKDWELRRLDESLLPSSMEVDWVRVWQRP